MGTNIGSPEPASLKQLFAREKLGVFCKFELSKSKAVGHPLFREMGSGRLPRETLRNALLKFRSLVGNFLKSMELNLAQTRCDSTLTAVDTRQVFERVVREYSAGVPLPDGHAAHKASQGRLRRCNAQIHRMVISTSGELRNPENTVVL